MEEPTHHTEIVGDAEAVEEEPVEERKEPEKLNVWNELMAEYNEKRQQIEDHKNSKLPPPQQPPKHPVLEYFNELVFPPLNKALTEVLKIKRQEPPIMPEDYYFNVLDFIAEYLWNTNPLYPERKSNWVDLKDITWI